MIYRNRKCYLISSKAESPPCAIWVSELLFLYFIRFKFQDLSRVDMATTKFPPSRKKFTHQASTKNCTASAGFFKVFNRVWINIVNQGKFERIAAYEGESLLSALQKFKVENVPGLIIYWILGNPLIFLLKKKLYAKEEKRSTQCWRNPLTRWVTAHSAAIVTWYYEKTEIMIYLQKKNWGIRWSLILGDNKWDHYIIWKKGIWKKALRESLPSRKN